MSRRLPLLLHSGSCGVAARNLEPGHTLRTSAHHVKQSVAPSCSTARGVPAVLKVGGTSLATFQLSEPERHVRLVAVATGAGHGALGVGGRHEHGGPNRPQARCMGEALRGPPLALSSNALRCTTLSTTSSPR